MSTLDVIFKSIIPDNIRSIPLVQKCTEILIEMINRNATISQRIMNLYTVDRVSFLKSDRFGNVTEVSDSAYLTETKNNLKNALFGTYLCILYDLAQKIQSDPSIIEATNSRNYQDTLINKNIYDVLTSEYLGAFRYFQQSSGTKKAIRYMYQFARYLETGYIYDDLSIEENGCFTTLYTGSLHKTFFSGFNQQISHPCGWCYEYDTIIEDMFYDYFGIDIIKTPARIVLKNSSNIVIFTTLTVEEFYSDLEHDNNVLSERSYTREEIDNIKNIRIIRTSNIEALNVSDSIILFNVGFVKLEDNVIYFDNDTILDYSDGIYYGDKMYIHDYERLYDLNTYNIQTGDIKESFNFIYHDEMNFEVDVLPDNVSYYKDDISASFRLYDGEYPYTPGVDETLYNVDVYKQENFGSFDLHVNFDIDELIHVTISDDYNHEYITNNKNTVLTTHGWCGDILNIRCRNYTLDFFFKINTLNRIDNSIIINTMYIIGNKLYVEGSSVTAGTYNLNGVTGDFTENIDLELDVPHDDEINLTLTSTTCNVRLSTNMHITRVNRFDLPFYENNVDYPVGIYRITEHMNNYPISGKTLSELTENNRVAKGYSEVQTDGSECYVIDSTKFSHDEFECDEILTGSFLSFDNNGDEGSFTDNRFLSVYENDACREHKRGMIGRMLTFM